MSTSLSQTGSQTISSLDAPSVVDISVSPVFTGLVISTITTTFAVGGGTLVLETQITAVVSYVQQCFFMYLFLIIRSGDTAP